MPVSSRSDSMVAAGCRTTCWCVLLTGLVGLVLVPNLLACWQWGKAIHQLGLRQVIFHFRRVRKLRSCSICTRVILPKELYKLCGCCDLLCCQHCALKGQASHEHMLHDEVEPLVVQTSQLATANCAAQALVTSFHLYSSRRCLGWRTGESYTWHSYEEIGSMSAHFADSLQQLLRKVSATKGTPVIGLLSAVSIPWFIVDFACSLAAIPLVTMHRATDDAALAQILDKTGLCLLIASMHLQPVIQRASSRASASKLQMVIWIEDSSEPYCLQQSSRPLATGTDSSPPSWQQKGFLDALQEGSQALRVPSWRDPKRLAKLLPSSGSTGAPKLAVVTEEALFKGSCGRTPESLPGRLGKLSKTHGSHAGRQVLAVLASFGLIPGLWISSPTLMKLSVKATTCSCRADE